jgi:hypothetical protein
MEMFYNFMVNVPLVRAKTASEALWNVQELMDDCFLLFLFRKPIISFRNDFDYVGSWTMKGFLPDSGEPVHPGDCPLRLGASASDAENELRYDMEKP